MDIGVPTDHSTAKMDPGLIIPQIAITLSIVTITNIRLFSLKRMDLGL